MANVLVNDASLQDIADAIREKNGTEETYKPSEMAEAIKSIVTIGNESGGNNGDISLGNHKVRLGQVTPSTSGTFSFNVGNGIDSANIVYMGLWLADISIIDNYSDQNILVSCYSRYTVTTSIIESLKSGVQSVDLKTAFGLRANGSILTFQSHANWEARPETYNWIVVYKEV